MKICVITLHTVNNYGSALQTYATQKLFEKIGCEVEVIDYWRKNNTDEHYAQTFLASPRIQRMHVLWDHAPIVKKCFLGVFELASKWKRRKIWRFIREHVTLSKRYFSNEELIDDPPLADVYVTGSDQVWNSIHNQGVELPYYLDFAPKGKKKIALSASIGRLDIDKNEKDLVVPFLRQYEFISIREMSGVRLMQSMGIDASLMVDPTLLISGCEWRKIAVTVSVQRPYIFVYQLNENSAMDNYVDQLAKREGLEIKRMEFRKTDRTKTGSCVGRTSVEEMLGYIISAACVVTDSFHATAFSLNLGVKFISVLPPRFSTRISDILELTNTTDRLLTDYNDFSLMDKCIGWKAVEEILESHREDAQRKLMKVIWNR